MPVNINIQLRRTTWRLLDEAAEQNHNLKQTILETRKLVLESRYMLDHCRAQVSASEPTKDKR